MGRGGLQLMLIIWLQGIWLPQHGYSFSRTPLWAGIYMIPLTLGFFLGPIAGSLSDRYGARGITALGMGLSAAGFVLLEMLPTNFSYIWFALIIFMFSCGMGLFFSPNQAAIMNSLPPDQRGAGAGMTVTFFNSAMVLSMGLFFTIVTLGLAATLPGQMFRGLTAAGISPAAAHQVASQPPIGSLFSAFLGYNPIQQLLGPTGALQQLPAPPGRLRHRALVLPVAHVRAVRPRAGSGLDVRCGHRGHRRRGLPVDGPPVCSRRGAGSNARDRGLSRSRQHPEPESPFAFCRIYGVEREKYDKYLGAPPGTPLAGTPGRPAPHLNGPARSYRHAHGADPPATDARSR